MKFDMHTPPRTIMEVYQMLPEGTLAELINGQLYMSPAPTNQHQRVLKKLLRVLDEFVEEKKLGEIFVSPSDVYLDEISNAVQPDLYFVSSANAMIIDDEKPNCGIPDLVIEILSSDQRHDLVTKKNLYEKFGVTEYWIIDPFDKSTLVYHLQNKIYQLTGKNARKIYSPLFQHEFEF